MRQIARLFNASPATTHFASFFTPSLVLNDFGFHATPMHRVSIHLIGSGECHYMYVYRRVSATESAVAALRFARRGAWASGSGEDGASSSGESGAGDADQDAGSAHLAATPKRARAARAAIAGKPVDKAAMAASELADELPNRPLALLTPKGQAGSYGAGLSTFRAGPEAYRAWLNDQVESRWSGNLTGTRRASARA